MQVCWGCICASKAEATVSHDIVSFIQFIEQATLLSDMHITNGISLMQPEYNLGRNVMAPEGIIPTSKLNVLACL